jgi:hypothetical protein
MNGSEASLARAIRGPITLITLGVLFALNNFTEYRFSQTWPVLLIVFGLLSLLRRGTEPPPAPRLAAPAWTAHAVPPQGGTFRQSSYPEAAPPARQPAGSPSAETAPPDTLPPARQTGPSGDSL